MKQLAVATLIASVAIGCHSQRPQGGTSAGDDGQRLIVAALNDDTTSVRSLIAAGVPMNVRFRSAANRLPLPCGGYAAGASDWTALHAAAVGASSDTIRLLLNAGADPNARDRYGVTPLFCLLGLRCGGARNTQSLGLLISAGAEVNARVSGLFGTVDGATPLHWAVERKELDAVRALLAAGADVNASDAQGRTPMDIALAEDDRGILAVLRSYGARAVARRNPAPPPQGIGTSLGTR